MVQDTTELKVEGLHLKFGGVKALQGVDFDARRGEILAIIGPNGAGKTCIINCITGFYRPQKGNIFFQNHDITGFRPDKVVPLGISRTFQSIQLYAGLSVLENLMAARHHLFKSNWVEELVYFGRARSEESKHRRKAEEIIDLLNLQRHRNEVVDVLPYGLRKQVDLGRALVQEPRLLLLDEPMAGMTVEEKEDMARFILDVQEESHITIVLIEHDMGVVMDISDRIVVLDFGRKIAEGPPDMIRHDPAVIQAYLGEEVKSQV